MKVKLLAPDSKPPVQATPSSAGFDLYAYASLTISPGERVVIPTGIAIALPEGYVGIIKPRSGMAVKHGIDVLAGVIDQDYRGEVKVALINHGDRDFFCIHGERIAQLVVTQYFAGGVEVVDDLDSTERGGSGFGSTGK